MRYEYSFPSPLNYKFLDLVDDGTFLDVLAQSIPPNERNDLLQCAKDLEFVFAADLLLDIGLQNTNILQFLLDSQLL